MNYSAFLVFFCLSSFFFFFVSHSTYSNIFAFVAGVIEGETKFLAVYPHRSAFSLFSHNLLRPVPKASGHSRDPVHVKGVGDSTVLNKAFQAKKSPLKYNPPSKVPLALTGNVLSTCSTLSALF